MTGATLEELRDIARRSRRAQRWGFLAVLVALLLYPAQFALALWVPAWAAIVALALGMMPGLRYAFLAGEERGAFRRVFRRLADEKRARKNGGLEASAPSVRIVPSGPAAQERQPEIARVDD